MENYKTWRELAQYLEGIADRCELLEECGFEAGVVFEPDGITLVIRGKGR